MSESQQTPAERLRQARVAAGFKTAAEFAAKHDIPQPTYQNHEAGGRGITVKAAKRYEQLLQNADAAWILTGHGRGPTGLTSLEGHRRAREAMQKAPGVARGGHPIDATAPTDFRARAVRVVARVQAGVWRESPELPGDERYDFLAPVEAPYAKFDLIGAEVVGNSMDLVYPEGTILICVNVIELGDGWMPEPGDRVVARRFSREGLYETTVKEFVVDERGRPWLVPRSSDPSLQAVPAETPEHDDDEPVKIVGLVIASYRPEQRGRRQGLRITERRERHE